MPAWHVVPERVEPAHVFAVTVFALFDDELGDSFPELVRNFFQFFSEDSVELIEGDCSGFNY